MFKKITIFIFLFLLAFFVIYHLKKTATQKNPHKINYFLENKNVTLLIADTPEKWERGLMFVKKLDDADGMIFIFPDKKIRTFWNKNTFVDLDIYWINGKNIIGKDFLPSISKTGKITTVDSKKEVNKVIEIIKK
ncbi:MAG: DUF192 domain-containing protein [Microgenomates group bacterium]|nr:DUF192 domain-containing protein [Microgenomates group bacterium]